MINEMNFQDLVSTPGMVTMLIVVLTVQLLSLVLLWLNVKIFRSQSRKYEILFRDLGDPNAWGTPGWFLVSIYIFIMAGATIATTIIFIFQPHLL